MKLTTLLRALLASLAIAASAIPATANAQSYTFGSLLSGSFSPAGSFAQMSVMQTGFNTFNFAVYSSNLNTLFTDGSFIGNIAIDTISGIKASDVTISNFSGTGVDGVAAVSGGGPGGGWNFRLSTGSGGAGSSGAYRFGANESASWTATFSGTNPVQFASRPFAMHVQGLTSSQGNSAWYTPSSTSPAPEPEIYVMMLSGLLFVGFAARRRRLTLPS